MIIIRKITAQKMKFSIKDFLSPGDVLQKIVLKNATKFTRNTCDENLLQPCLQLYQNKFHPKCFTWQFYEYFKNSCSMIVPLIIFIAFCNDRDIRLGNSIFCIIFNFFSSALLAFFMCSNVRNIFVSSPTS